MTNQYDPKQYWEDRLTGTFNSRGVGNISFSKSYNDWLYRRKKRCIEATLKHTILKGKEVLDVGCGTGFFVEWYINKGAIVSGIDITEISVRRLRRSFPGEFWCGDISDVNFTASRKFDIINCWDVFYHIVDDDAFYQALENIAASLRSGGLLLFSDFVGEANDVKIANHVKGRCLKTYSSILTRDGFRLVENCPLFWSLDKQHIARIDNHMGWLYYFLDNLQTKVHPGNLSLSVWRSHCDA